VAYLIWKKGREKNCQISKSTPENDYEQIMKIFWSCEKILTILWSIAAKSVFRYFPARQVPAIIFNESSKNTENAVDLEIAKVYSEKQSIPELFFIESSFQNCFWTLFGFYTLSQIFKIRNV
jgi:hypothetical protein